MFTVPTQKDLERNISLLHWTSGLTWVRFFIPVLALFYVASQVPLEKFAVIFGVSCLTVVLLDIPTGVLADLFGKKKTLIISTACFCIELLILAFGAGFWAFLIAKIISGIGVSMTSGTTSSLIYDSLKGLGRESEHKKILGTYGFIRSLTMAGVFGVGAWLFTIDPKLPAYLSIAPTFLALILFCFITEPIAPHRQLTLNNSWLHFKESLKLFMQNKTLQYVGFLVFVVTTTIAIMQTFSSAYFVEIKVPVVLIGLFALVLNLISATSNKFAHSLETKLGPKRTISLTIILLLASMIGFASMNIILGSLSFIFLFVIFGYFNIIVADYVNLEVKTTHRATQLSINNMFSNLGQAVCFPVFGYAIKAISFATTLKYSAMIVFAYCLIFIIFWYLNGYVFNPGMSNKQN